MKIHGYMSSHSKNKNAGFFYGFANWQSNEGLECFSLSIVNDTLWRGRLIKERREKRGKRNL